MVKVEICLQLQSNLFLLVRAIFKSWYIDSVSCQFAPYRLNTCPVLPKQSQCHSDRSGGSPTSPSTKHTGKPRATQSRLDHSQGTKMVCTVLLNLVLTRLTMNVIHNVCIIRHLTNTCSHGDPLLRYIYVQ